ncbi:class I SAM-dependent methyltransferase [Paenibacillus sp. MCAF9]|uniref:class I SAM-dependent methyltransferase n=1 Tax=Paenibacillus sp. MCAF9 TaxID=3233046 RepID=UPI003F9761D5
MNKVESFQNKLIEFSDKFDRLAVRYDHTVNNSSELENLIDEYSKFVTNRSNHEAWDLLGHYDSNDILQLVVDLRRKSAFCVAIMEKYRALKLHEGNAEITDYFKNIESCIEEEFGSFQLSSDSKVLLIGSGAFPMTPILIAKRTRAEVVGLDIDDEAIELGRSVVEKLGSGLKIRLEKRLVEKLEFTTEATHIIFSSTVENKYDILDQLYSLTNEHVVVAVRYGEQLKSLFNFPLKEVNAQKWKLVEQVTRPDHLFDIALYKKA